VANTQAQFGFAQFGYLPGSAPDYQLSRYAIQSTYATAIYFGDPVVKSAAAGGTLGQYIQPATGTGSLTAISGIFQGCTYTPKGGIPGWLPWYPPTAAGADTTAYVIDAPNALFRVAALLTAVPPSAIGEGIGYSTGAGGTTLGGGFSTFTVDQSLLTTGAVAPFQVYSMYPGVGNGSDTTTNYAWCIVAFNAQRFKQLTTIA
jgi:hypothetical protein